MNFYSSFDDFLRNVRKLTAAKVSVSFREHLLCSPAQAQSQPGKSASLEKGIQEAMLCISKAHGNEPVCFSFVVYSLSLCSETN